MSSKAFDLVVLLLYLSLCFFKGVLKVVYSELVALDFNENDLFYFHLKLSYFLLELSILLFLEGKRGIKGALFLLQFVDLMS